DGRDEFGLKIGSGFYIYENSSTLSYRLERVTNGSKGIVGDFDNDGSGSGSGASLKLNISMNDEDDDFLVYKLYNMSMGASGKTIYSSLSGILGTSNTDDRYRLSNTINNLVSNLSLGAWTHFASVISNYSLIYDNNTLDSFGNSVISFVGFNYTSNITFNGTSIYNDTSGNWAMKIKYNISNVSTGSDYFMFLLAFTNGTNTSIDQWMPNIYNGQYPNPNFFTNPSGGAPANNPPSSPSPLINSTLGTNLTNQDLNCYFTPSDPDAGETLLANLIWLRNNVTNFTLNSLSVTQNALYVSTLNRSNLTVNDLWNCEVQICDDSSGCSAWVNSSQLRILNRIPNNATPLINSTDGTNSSNVDLNVFFTPSDPDSDVSECDIIWMNNNITNLTFNSLTCTNGTLFTHTLKSGNLTAGENWSAQVRVRDVSMYNSSWVNSTQLNILISNTPPNVTFISLNDSRTVLEGGIRSIIVSFLAVDPDSNIDNNTAKVNVSKDTVSVTNSSCSNSMAPNNYINFTCTIQIPYWYDAGSWSVTAFINDTSNLPAQNTTSWSLEELTAINTTSTSLTWSTVVPNSYNKTSNNDPIILHNTGNKDTLNIYVEGIDLYEDSAGATMIPAANFTVFNKTSNDVAPNIECDYRNKTVVVTYGAFPIVLVNNTDVIIVQNSLPRGAGNIESVYFCLFHVPPNLISATYSTSGTPNEDDWVIGVQ
ncbi:MAG: hypothetical protein V1663_05580, partial [archaeon]